jgi:hypothetical protein
MIEGTLSAYACVGAITFLDISNNRLELCAGLDRLLALEKVDLRNNNIEEADEIGRLSVIPTIREVCAEGNPLEDDWRIRCFNRFKQDGLDIILDGSGPSFLEKSYLTSPPVTQPVAGIQQHDVVISNPTAISVSPRASPSIGPSPPTVTTQAPSPETPAQSPPLRPKKRVKRLVELGTQSEGVKIQEVITSSPIAAMSSSEPPIQAQPAFEPTSPRRKHGHGRHATEAGTPSTVRISPSASRRSKRVTASVHEPPPLPTDLPSSSDELRARMEALRNETGEDFLRVLAQREPLKS